MNDIKDTESADEAWSKRGETAYVGFSRHPFRWIIGIVVGLIVVGIVISIIGFAASWWGAGKEIVSPKNVKAQYAAAFDNWNSLKATTTNICAVNAAEKRLPPGSDAFIQQENFRNGFITNYNRVKSDYDARMHDLFRAKLVKPRDLPITAPTLDEAVAKACPALP